MLIIIIVVVVAPTISSPKKPRVSDYLSVSHAGSFGRFLPYNQVEITLLGLRITAVLGNATSIVVQVDEGNQPYPENDVYKNITKGQYLDVTIQLEGCILPLEDGKCTIHIDIGCIEAAGPETIPIEILQEDIVAAGP